MDGSYSAKLENRSLPSVLAWRSIEAALGPLTKESVNDHYTWTWFETVSMLRDKLVNQDTLWVNDSRTSEIIESCEVAVVPSARHALNQPFKFMEASNGNAHFDKSFEQTVGGFIGDAANKAESASDHEDFLHSLQNTLPINDDLTDPKVTEYYGYMRRSLKAFSLAYTHIPNMPLEHYHTSEECLEALHKKMVRAYVMKNGYSLTKAKLYAEAMTQALGLRDMDTRRLQLLVLAPYTTNPEAFWDRAGMLTKRISHTDGEVWNKQMGICYVKFFTISTRKVRNLVHERPSRNAITRARLPPLLTREPCLDERAQSFIQNVLKIDYNETEISINQSGIYKQVARKRLALEIEELNQLARDIHREETKPPRTWIELLYSAQGKQNARYYVILQYREIERILGCSSSEARGVSECGLFGLLEGAANMNVAALGDAKTRFDVHNLQETLLGLLAKENLFVDPHDISTLDLLVRSGYSGGPFDAYLKESSKNGFYSVRLNEAFDIKVVPDPQDGTPRFRGIWCFTQIRNQYLRLIPLSPGSDDDQYVGSFRLTSPYRDSVFSPRSGHTKLKVILCPHPYLDNHLALRAVTTFRGGQVDWVSTLMSENTRGSEIPSYPTFIGSIKAFPVLAVASRPNSTLSNTRTTTCDLTMNMRTEDSESVRQIGDQDAQLNFLDQLSTINSKMEFIALMNRILKEKNCLTSSERLLQVVAGISLEEGWTKAESSSSNIRGALSALDWLDKQRIGAASFSKESREEIYAKALQHWISSISEDHKTWGVPMQGAAVGTSVTSSDRSFNHLVLLPISRLQSAKAKVQSEEALAARVDQRASRGNVQWLAFLDTEDITPNEDHSGSDRRGWCARPYKCRFCNLSLSSVSLMTEHHMAHHKAKPQFECNRCDSFKTSISTEIVKHIKKMHHDLAPQGQQRSESAEESSTTRGVEMATSGVQSETQSFACPYPTCDKAFRTKSALTDHIDIRCQHTNTTIEIACPFCGEVSTSINGRRTHIGKGSERCVKFFLGKSAKTDAE
ncbi:hypothetical protein V865_000194 [Kwoniella europaea PYCC6329]|uniref:C2H2-type domain-containing protein n=1 Tax=Kwoniella europaea PYCC6329 TaxID=1423913 RepID=A0AAX4K6Q2_9TREE